MNKVHRRIFLFLLVVSTLLIAFCLGIVFWVVMEKIGTVPIEPIIKKAEGKEAGMIGVASWYDYDLAGYPGYSKDYRTCASRDWPRQTILIVIYRDRFTTCVVNDYVVHPDRDIDLSSLAFSDLAPLSKGVLRGVEIRKRKIQWE